MYKFLDVSTDTIPAVIGHRTIERQGIVIHETIGYDSLQYLQGGALNEGRKVSSDYLLARNGDCYQITPPGWFAYHSGIARWRGYQEEDHTINRRFIGIEVENNPDV